MTESGQIRQGDILLVPTSAKPPVGLGMMDEVVIAEGEATGHAHRLHGSILEWEDEVGRYVHVVGDVAGELSHEDHDPTPAAVVEPGQTYRIIIQREWTVENQWRTVVD